MELQEEKTIVGYALKPSKVKSILQPKLQDLAGKNGILFVEIDQNSPLSDQGPFHIILHKLSGKEWWQALEEYCRTHPHVTIVDPPDAIQQLHNRQSMLQCVADIKLNFSHGKVDVPKQLVFEQDTSSIYDAVTEAGLKLPVGGVLFKVYVAGSTMKVVKRFSVPDVCIQELANNPGVFHLPRISASVTSVDDADLYPSVAEIPPHSLLEKLAEELRSRLGLRLFNFDVIWERGTKDKFHVLDINYFPGYEKLPDYEHMFRDFRVWCMAKTRKHPGRDLLKEFLIFLNKIMKNGVSF